MNPDDDDFGTEWIVLVVLLLVVIGVATVLGLVGFGIWSVL